jgi:hypothetical protein
MPAVIAAPRQHDSEDEKQAIKGGRRTAMRESARSAGNSPLMEVSSCRGLPLTGAARPDRSP